MKTCQKAGAGWIVVGGLALAGLLAVFPPAVFARAKKSPAPAAKVDLNVATMSALRTRPA
jgi:hypothetical protein